MVYVLVFRSHQMYYMFGFLFLVFLILIVTCSEATILLCYFHLCAEVSMWLLAKSCVVYTAVLRLCRVCQFKSANMSASPIAMPLQSNDVCNSCMYSGIAAT